MLLNFVFFGIWVRRSYQRGIQPYNVYNSRTTVQATSDGTSDTMLDAQTNNQNVLRCSNRRREKLIILRCSNRIRKMLKILFCTSLFFAPVFVQCNAPIYYCIPCLPTLVFLSVMLLNSKYAFPQKLLHTRSRVHGGILQLRLAMKKEPSPGSRSRDLSCPVPC